MHFYLAVHAAAHGKMHAESAALVDITDVRRKQIHHLVFHIISLCGKCAHLTGVSL